MFTLAASALDLAGLGSVLLGLAGIGAVVVNFYVAHHNTKTIEASAVKIGAIDHAVNGKAPGVETIAEQVDDLHSDRLPEPSAKEINGSALLPLVRLLVLYAEEQRTKPEPPAPTL